MNVMLVVKLLLLSVELLNLRSERQIYALMRKMIV